MNRPFTLNHRPFFPLGAQAHNSSGYNQGESEAAFRAVNLLHGNMLEIPVYWEQVEPVEGEFDFASVDALLDSARRHKLRLALLWFGAWKNGNMDYAPAWVKSDVRRFWRVQSPTGKKLWVLSSHCPATLEADSRAFEALCHHLKAVDSDGIVFTLQIENEPGILGSDRDYGPAGQSAFESPVPAGLIEKMRTVGQGHVYESWQKAGGRASGSWPEIFGADAGEMMTACSIAVYCNRLAEAGKAVLPIPMYVNVWLQETNWNVPGESYPSGGAVTKALDMYKWNAPALDLIAPDIYIPDRQGYTGICEVYRRSDNPLFIPESAGVGSNAWNLFRAIGEYDSIGYAFFAVEEILTPDGGIKPEFQMLVDSYHCAAAAIPLLLKYQGTGKIHTIIQEENLHNQRLELERWLGLIDFGGHYRDWRHSRPADPASAKRGRGWVFQTGENEFYVVGTDFRLHLRPKLPAEQMLDISTGNDRLISFLPPYMSVEEGYFDEKGNFICSRRRNGDEIDYGIWAAADVGVVRVVMAE